MYRNEKQKELILKLMKGGHLRGSEIIPYDPAHGLPEQLPASSLVHVDNMMMGHVF